MEVKTLQQKRERIAELGGFVKATNYPPHVWKNGNKILTNISFDKPNMMNALMGIVDHIEQSKNLIVEIKRHECIIKEMHLTSHRTIVSVDGDGSKQNAIFNAVSYL